MTKIVEIQYDGHIELKQTQSPNKLSLEKNSNWYTDPSRLVFALSHYRFISKFCSGKKRVLIVGMRALEWPACAFSLSKIGYIICKIGAELKALAERRFQNILIFSMDGKVVYADYQPMAKYLFTLSNVKMSES